MVFKRLCLFGLALCAFARAFEYPSSVIDMANRPNQQMMMSMPAGPVSHDFRAELFDGSVIRFRSVIYEDSLKGEYVRLDDETFFSSSKKDSEKRFTTDFKSLKAYSLGFPITAAPNADVGDAQQKMDTTWYESIVHDSKWLFKKFEGKLSLYTSDPMGNDYTYMKFDDGPMEPFVDTVFRAKIGKNPESIRLLDNRAIGKGASIGLVIVGGLVALLGVVSSDQEVPNPSGGPSKHEFEPSPAIYIGLGMVATSWIPWVIVKDNFAKAVYKYNF